MTKLAHSILLFSAVISGLCFFLLSLVGIFFYMLLGFPKDLFAIFIACIFGCFGYAGIFNLLFNRFDEKLKRSLLFLLSGLIAIIYMFFWLRIDMEFLIKMDNEFTTFLLGISYFWTCFVAIFYIILLSKKLIQNKKRIKNT